MISLNFNKVRRCFKTSIILWIASSIHSSEGDTIHTEERNQRERNSKDLNSTGTFSLTLNISLDGKESILEASFLKAGLQQSIKNYINEYIKCDDKLSTGNGSFFGFEIMNEGAEKVSGRGFCRGNRERCQWGANHTLSKGEEENSFISANMTDEYCGKFRNSTIFDYFSEIVMTGNNYSYNLDVDLINDLEGDLEGDLDLNYNVTFDFARGDGLDQIDNITFNSEELVEMSITCTTNQCIAQRSIMSHIYRDLGLPIDRYKPECSYHGVNCNADGLVTQIFLGEFYEFYSISSSEMN